MTLADRMKRVLELHLKKKELEAEAKAVAAEYREQETLLVEEMALSGFQSVNVDGYNLHRKTRRSVNKVGGVSMQEACQYLDSHGLGFMVSPKYASPTLKSYVIETLDDPQRSLPEDWANYFHVLEEPVIGVLKS